MAKNKNKEKAPRLSKKEIHEGLLTLFEMNPTKDLDIKHIFRHLQAKTHGAKMLVMDVIDDLVFDDYLARAAEGVYRRVHRSNDMIGTFRRKRNGHNIFVPDDGGKDILVCERNAMHALDGDRVRVTMLARRHGHTREAQVTEIVERVKDTFVGQLQVEKNYAFLITESRSLATDIFIPKTALKGGKTGDKALVQIVEWPDDSKSPIGKVIDILGKQGENNAEMHAILAEYGLPYKYPANVERAAEKIEPGITPEEVARRLDMRDVLTVTIDPEDAKDFDDAISICPLEKGE
jgi:ribonuclease R